MHYKGYKEGMASRPLFSLRTVLNQCRERNHVHSIVAAALLWAQAQAFAGMSVPRFTIVDSEHRRLLLLVFALVAQETL